MKHENATAVVSIAALFLLGAGAVSAQELNMLTWEGYADPSFIATFEQASSCRVNATYVGSNDDFAPKLAAGGGVYDIIVPSIDTIGLMRLAGFVDPIDTSKITGFDGVFEKFRTDPEVTAEGSTWSVPLVWGTISIMYRADKVEGTPGSIAALWDRKYAGRISMWDDKSAIYWTARLLGMDNIYDLSDEQLEEVKAKLIEQKPLIRKYWATAGELAELYTNDEVWISNTWTGNVLGIADRSGKVLDLVEFNPTEKSEGWMDSMMLVKGSPNTDCSYAFFNYMMTPEGQCGIAASTGYWPANPVAAKQCLTAEEFTAKHLDDIDYLNDVVMWEMPARLDKYIETWNAVKAAQ
jgi:putative spermidine/putrescine transport system substrate-binding protein/spermidine/putrescine transport system substrate-binding protein